MTTGAAFKAYKTFEITGSLGLHLDPIGGPYSAPTDPLVSGEGNIASARTPPFWALQAPPFPWTTRCCRWIGAQVYILTSPKWCHLNRLCNVVHGQLTWSVKIKRHKEAIK